MRRSALALALTALLLTTACSSDGAEEATDQVGQEAGDGPSVPPDRWPPDSVLDEPDPGASPRVQGRLSIDDAERYAAWLADAATYSLRTTYPPRSLRMKQCEVCAEVVARAEELREQRQLVETEPWEVVDVVLAEEQPEAVDQGGKMARFLFVEVTLRAPAGTVLDDTGAEVETTPAEERTEAIVLLDNGFDPLHVYQSARTG